jgi:hypothetical protein
MHDFGLEFDRPALTLQRALLKGLRADLAAAAGTALGRSDQLRVLAEKLGNHLARDLVELDYRLPLDLVERG